MVSRSSFSIFESIKDLSPQILTLHATSSDWLQRCKSCKLTLLPKEVTCSEIEADWRDRQNAFKRHCPKHWRQRELVLGPQNPLACATTLHLRWTLEMLTDWNFRRKGTTAVQRCIWYVSRPWSNTAPCSGTFKRTRSARDGPKKTKTQTHTMTQHLSLRAPDVELGQRPCALTCELHF